MPRVVELEIPPRSDHLALVRLVVTSAASLGGAFTDRRVDDLRLAVSEACANAVDAVLAGEGKGPVVVRVEVGEDEVAVTVTDRGGGFEPAEVEAIPGATEPGRLRHEHGLGIPLMRSLVDEVTFAKTADGTAVRLAVRA